MKYVEPAHAPLYKHIQPAPFVKHIQPAPVVNYVTAAPIAKYVHSEPHHPVHPGHSVKYIEQPHYAKHVDYDTPVHYEFGYDVHDSVSGDIKSHTEKRDGDTVHGRYEVLDPVGY